jgi:hypothetical protein
MTRRNRATTSRNPTLGITLFRLVHEGAADLVHRRARRRRAENRSILAFACATLLFPCSAAADGPLADFEDGTPQGWTMSMPSVGTLTVNSGGNPGFCLAATDGMPDGAPLLARAPGAFVGDLTGFDSIQWDEFVLDYGSNTVQATWVLLRGPNGTLWASFNALEVVGSWNSRSVPFVESAWIHVSGSESFSVVLANVEALFLSMDTAYLDEIALESEVDNVALIPAAPTPVPEPPEVRTPTWGRVKTVFAARR